MRVFFVVQPERCQRANANDHILNSRKKDASSKGRLGRLLKLLGIFPPLIARCSKKNDGWVWQGPAAAPRP